MQKCLRQITYKLTFIFLFSELSLIAMFDSVVFPQKRCVGLLIPSASKCDLSGTLYDLYRDNQVKNEVSGWTLIEYD